MEYREFRVVVKDLKNVMIIKPPNNENQDGKIRMDRLTEKTIDIFSEWLSRGDVSKPDELIVLGSNLYNLLFDEDLSKEFKREFDRIKGLQSRSIRLRLVLEFKPEARDLAEMPWEYIYYPDTPTETGFFIATESWLILARHVPSKLDTLRRDEGKLRILIVVSTPQREENGVELGPVAGKHAIDAIEKFQRSLPNTITVEKSEQPDRHDLWEKVNTFRPHVLHFIGHGKYETREGGSLSLVSSEDKEVVDWINDADLARLFSDYQPRLIFLHACEGAYTDSYNAFRGLALQLVYAKVRAVIAMQYKVANDVANLFTKRFYESLGQGKRIDEAVQEGRRELATFLNNDKSRFNGQAFGCPVVFIQDAEGIIIANEQVEEDKQQVASPADEYPCFNCGEQVRITQSFCFNCGKAVTSCPSCRHIIPKTATFCGDCGFNVKQGSARPKVEAAAPVAPSSALGPGR